MAKNQELYLTAKGKLLNFEVGPANVNATEVRTDFLDLNIDGIRLMKAEITDASVLAGGTVTANIINVTLYLFDGVNYNVIKSFTGTEIAAGTKDFMAGGNVPVDANGNTYFNFDYAAGKLALGITPQGTSFGAKATIQVYFEEYS